MDQAPGARRMPCTAEAGSHCERFRTTGGGASTWTGSPFRYWSFVQSVRSRADYYSTPSARLNSGPACHASTRLSRVTTVAGPQRGPDRRSLLFICAVSGQESTTIPPTSARLNSAPVCHASTLSVTTVAALSQRFVLRSILFVNCTPMLPSSSIPVSLAAVYGDTRRRCGT
jgi:hypothetical protein